MPAQSAASAVSPAPLLFESQRLERVFNRCFGDQWRTSLTGGAPEPVYRPAANESGLHVIRYRGDYFASALHEVAHWCIAGAQRRQLADYGYWYTPDGRTAEQQRHFEAVEFQPQALEWWFSKACGYCFRISADNLGAGDDEPPDNGPFAQRVLEQARCWQLTGLPKRASLFYAALCSEFGGSSGLSQAQFSLAELV